MAIALHIDQAGGANFEGYDLRNVGRLAVGQLALPDTGFNFQWTGAAKGASLEVTGLSTLRGIATVGDQVNDIGALAIRFRDIFIRDANLAGALLVAGSSTFGPQTGGVGNFPAVTLRGGVDASTNASFVFEISDTGATGLAPKNLLIRGTSSGSDIAFAPASGLETAPSLILRAAGGVEMSGALTVTGTATMRAIAAGTDTAYDIGGSATRFRDIYARGMDLSGSLLVSGIARFGTTVTTSAAAGEMVLANAKALRFANAAGTNTENLIGTNASDTILLGNGSRIVALGGATQTAGVSAGEAVLPYNKGLRGVDSAGTGTYALIGSFSGFVRVGDALTAIQFNGANVSSGVSAGDLVIGNAKSLRGVNGAGTGTVPMVDLNSSNMVQIGSGGAAVVLGTSLASALGANSGDVVLGNAKALRFVNGAGTSTIAALLLNASNDLHLGYNTNHSQYGLAVEGAALTAEQTAVHLLCNIGGALSVKQVLIGAADSDGTGFRSLRIAN